jgi:hypothetical protein
MVPVLNCYIPQVATPLESTDKKHFHHPESILDNQNANNPFPNTKQDLKRPRKQMEASIYVILCKGTASYAQNQR